MVYYYLFLRKSPFSASFGSIYSNLFNFTPFGVIINYYNQWHQFNTVKKSNSKDKKYKVIKKHATKQAM